MGKTPMLWKETMLKSAIAAVLVVVVVGVAQAQYPQVPQEVSRAENEKKRAADERSDEMFAKAQAAIEEWGKKGKPFIPGAGKPEDLPQAKIPAFPGAEGGGMYSFGGRGGKV
jgi:hypothetical protein